MSYVIKYEHTQALQQCLPSFINILNSELNNTWCQKTWDIDHSAQRNKVAQHNAENNWKTANERKRNTIGER